MAQKKDVQVNSKVVTPEMSIPIEKVSAIYKPPHLVGVKVIVSPNLVSLLLLESPAYFSLKISSAFFFYFVPLQAKFVQKTSRY